MNKMDSESMKIVDKIKGYRPEDQPISLLKSWLDEIRHIDNIDAYLDLGSLNSCPLPDHITAYPVWAVDFKGDCLAGEDLSDISPLSEIIAYYDSLIQL